LLGLRGTTQRLAKKYNIIIGELAIDPEDSKILCPVRCDPKFPNERQDDVETRFCGLGKNDSVL
jgi:hypothetical protein